MSDPVITHLIAQEIQLLERVALPQILAELIDDEFIEVGSSATVYDKGEVMRWLNQPDSSITQGYDFKGQLMATDVVLLTYISMLQKTPTAPKQYTRRSSLWRCTQGQWRMVFHQGTPMKAIPDECL